MLINFLEHSFAGGEVSGSVYPRTDIEKYKSSLRTARNVIIHPHGGASNRPGSQFIARAKYSASTCVASEFIFSNDRAYVLEFGHYYVRFYTDGAQIQSNGTPYQVSTPYISTDVADLRFESSADVIWITHPNYQTMTLTRYGNTDWVLEEYAPEDGPFMPENIDESASLTVSAVTGNGVTMTLSSSTTTDTSVVMLLHGDGTDASTTITDSSSFGRAMTANGNAQIDTAQKLFGTGSILFDGTGDYVTAADSADFYFASSDFTIEAALMWNTLPTTAHMIYNQQTDANNQFRFELNKVGSDYSLYVYIYEAGVAVLTFISDALPLNTGVFYRVCLVRNGSVWTFRLNGVTVGTTSYAPALPNYTGVVTIGVLANDNTTYAFNGWMDEFRVSREAKYTSDYTPSTAAFSVTTVTPGSVSFDPLHVGGLFKLVHYVEGQLLAVAFTSATTSSSIKCFTTWRIITHGTWTGKLKIEKSIDGGTTWTVLRAFSSTADFNANTSGTEDVETNEQPFLIRINMYSYTSGTCNVDLTSDPFYQEGIVRVASFISSVSVTADVLQEVGYTTATSSWSEGSWSDYRGYPAHARFYQDRLAFANSRSEPTTFWMTETGNYYSFVRHSPLLNSDSISSPLPSRQLNAINGLLSFKKLLAFTSSAVWSIGPTSTNGLTPTTTQIDIEEYNGSSDVAQVAIGMEAVYNQFGGELINNIGYQLQSDGFTGNQVNILAKHLFEGYTITKMAYQKNPNGIVWCLRSDGVLLGVTYLKEQELVAWTQHDTTGTVMSMCVIPQDGDDELWLVVERTNGIFFEKASGRKQFQIDDLAFMDSYTLVSSSTETVSALSHLANQIVARVGDGEDLGTQTVSAGGTLALSANYDSLYIGLPYESDLETLDIEIPMQDGTLQGSKVKIGNVTFRVLNTRGGYIGPDEDNLKEAFTYEALKKANGGTLGATENFSGDIRLPLGSGYTKGGRVFYRQTAPLPVTIGAIISEIEVGGKGS